MLATFDAGTVHEVYGTFALGRDAEWVCRLFVLDMLEEGEEGVGTHLTIQHESPAPLGSTVDFTAWIERLDGRQLDCGWRAQVGDRVVATGTTGQRIVNKAKFNQLIAALAPKPGNASP